jgi:hypothetical protein
LQHAFDASAYFKGGDFFATQCKRRAELFQFGLLDGQLRQVGVAFDQQPLLLDRESLLEIFRLGAGTLHREIRHEAILRQNGIRLGIQRRLGVIGAQRGDGGLLGEPLALQ